MAITITCTKMITGRLPLSTTVEEIPFLKKPAIEKLKEMGVGTLSDLLQYTEEHLHKKTDIGRPAALDIRIFLNQWGYHLNGEYCGWSVGCDKETHRNLILNDYVVGRYLY